MRYFLKDPIVKKQTPPETNENEFCVMMTSDASKEIEKSIKRIFGRCDWLKIIEACPVPNQVRQGTFSQHIHPSLYLLTIEYKILTNSRSIPETVYAHSECLSKYAELKTLPFLFKGNDYFP